MTSSADQTWTAGSEAEAMMRGALEASAGFPVPDEGEFARRVIEQLGRRGYRLAPILKRRRVFVPIVVSLGESVGNMVAWLDPIGSVGFSESPNVPPDQEPGWQLMYVEMIEDVDTQESNERGSRGAPAT